MSNQVSSQEIQNKDPHRAVAARVFGISESEVTEEQRRYAKSFSFMHLYHGNPSTVVNPKEGQ